MTAEENKAIFRKFMRELRNGNLAIVDEVCSPNFQFHSPNFPNWPRGLEGARTLATEGSRLIADGETTVDDFFATEDRVVVRMTIRGTYVGDKSVPVCSAKLHVASRAPRRSSSVRARARRTTRSRQALLLRLAV